MPGQAIVTVENKQWSMDVATLSWELSQGLGNIAEIPPATGMIFDLGYEQTIEVTTVPMLFSLDIAFLSEDLVITEIYRDVEPGYLVTSQIPTRYFLEVNAGELEGVESGAAISVDYLAVENVLPAETDIVSAIVPFVGFLVMGGFSVMLMKDVVEGFIKDENSPELMPQNGSPATCEIVRPYYYDVLSWVGSPLPDYSFSIEPEVKERKIDEVLKRLKEGVEDIQDSANFKQFLLTMSKFHDYSIGNLILIMLQKPQATRVAGFKTWKDLGRWVKKGEKGIAILAPCFPPKGQKEEDEKDKDEEEIELNPIYFKVVHVFDILQTEGTPLPEFDVPVLTGEANENLFDYLLYHMKQRGVSVDFTSKPEMDPGVKGYFGHDGIWVRPEESRAQQLKTFLHEVAHYYSEDVFQIPRADAETIAESVAFVVGAHFGFDTGVRSFSYVALWAKEKKILESNLSAIRKISMKMIDALSSIESLALA
jgi:uncharacterized membrane protein (UPF0127 family)